MRNTRNARIFETAIALRRLALLMEAKSRLPDWFSFETPKYSDWTTAQPVWTKLLVLKENAAFCIECKSQNFDWCPLIIRKNWRNLMSLRKLKHEAYKFCNFYDTRTKTKDTSKFSKLHLWEHLKCRNTWYACLRLTYTYYNIYESFRNVLYSQAFCPFHADTYIIHQYRPLSMFE